MSAVPVADSGRWWLFDSDDAGFRTKAMRVPGGVVLHTLQRQYSDGVVTTTSTALAFVPCSDHEADTWLATASSYFFKRKAR